MTARDKAHTHLENARVCFQDSANRSRSRVDLYAACILSVLEEAVDGENVCLLQLMTETSRRLRKTAARIERGLPNAGQN